MTYPRKGSLVLAIILLATCLVYANGLSNPFVIDDRIIIFNNFGSGQSWRLEDLFKRGLFGKEPSESPYFRPLTLLTFALNHQVAGERPEGYRAANIAIHLLVIVLTFLLLSRLTEKWVAAFSALLFALHPAHVQAVSYISSRSEPLYTLLALLCLLLWDHGSKTEGIRKRLYLGSALSVFFLGLFAKETMVVIVPLIVAMELIWHRARSWRDSIRDHLPWYGGLVALFGIYFFLRIGLGYPLLMEDGTEVSLGSRVLIALKLFSLYLGLVFYPVHLHFFRVVPTPQSFFEWQVILGTSILGGLVVLAHLSWSIRRELSFGILWFLISILPVLNLTFLNAPMMEHWLYLPLIGLSLAIVSGVRTLAERVGETRGAALGLALLALLLSARTITRNAEWRDLVKLFSQNVSSYPGDSLAWFWLGSALKDQGMVKDAIMAFKAGLAINPNFKKAWLDLGESLSLAGKDDEAEAAFSRAIPIEPQDPLIYHMLGVHRLKSGKNWGAVEALEKSLALRPAPGTYHALGSAYLRLGEKDKAEQAFHKALVLYPGDLRFHAEVHVNLGKLYLDQGNHQLARDEWQIALRFEPDHPEARSLLKRQAK